MCFLPTRTSLSSPGSAKTPFLLTWAMAGRLTTLSLEFQVYNFGMDSSSCAECHAIQQELEEAFAAVKERLSDQPTTPQEIVTWIQRLDEAECAG
jgi:hypothetical protein